MYRGCLNIFHDINWPINYISSINKQFNAIIFKSPCTAVINQIIYIQELLTGTKTHFKESLIHQQQVDSKEH